MTQEIWKAAVSKKTLMKQTYPLWVEIKWADAEPEVCLILEKPDLTGKGDVDLHTYQSRTCSINNHAVHTQVLKIIGPLQVPSNKS